MNSKQIENAAKAAMGLAAGSDYFLDMLEKDLSLPNIPVRVMNNKKTGQHLLNITDGNCSRI